MAETADTDATSRREECACYHCGLPVPNDADYTVSIDGGTRKMCCAGCQAVAQAIVDNGLGEYYRHRDAMPEPRREAMPEELKELGLFDHPDFQKSFVRPVEGGNEREASLILEGITCAACVWLNESHVARQPGVTAVDINYATRRARVRWDESKTQLSSILAAISAIGYRAYPYDTDRSEKIARAERKNALWRLFVAGFGMMQVMMYAIPVYLADDGTMTHDILQLMRWASLILTLPVVLYSSATFFRNAWRDLLLRRVGMDVPVALGVGAAFGASVWATLTGGGEVYFDSVTMFVFFLLFGRYLEMMARQKAVRSVEEITKLLPTSAQRLPRYPDLTAERVAVTSLAPGDVLLVKPGEVIPADGVVLDGQSMADESLLTGESRPVPKASGDTLTGGSVNSGSPLVMRVERVGGETRLAAIQRLMERAATEKPKVVQMADSIAARFVGILLLLAAVTGGAWMVLDPGRALWVFVSVLVVSCPCALSLATPAALTVATGVLSRRGLLATRGHAIETLARATHFVFDKTGTLTRGRLRLVRLLPMRGDDAQELLALAVALEQGSEHAIGVGLRNALAASAVLPQVSEIRAVTGQGVEGVMGGRRCRVGRPDYVSGLHDQALPRDLALPGTVVALGDEAGWLAFVAMEDELRPEAAAMVAELKRDGMAVSILSGDTPAAVATVAAHLGIEDAHGGLSPQGKHDFIRALQEAGAIVAMVGDGVNDAPVLAQAQVSVAMGGGTELARTQGDFVLLSENLGHLGIGLTLARRTLAVIRQNLWWAFGYNFVAIPLAMFGFVSPWMAGIGMSASSLLVVLNALRLQKGAPMPPAGAGLEAA
ncbi:MAG: heavy metal translocating P-type ATPase [Rhodocyclaceae bacterium]|nr:heavy metal translocating P-type ATPase [Rhodocyclaceae bacterium]